MNTSKVEIKCLDTSKLPKVPAKLQFEMIKRYKNGEIKLKNEIINCNLRLVLSLVKKFNNRGENIDDIFQIGVVGLIKAINNFDVNQNVQFSTYAVPMIIGEIKRYLRDNSSFRVARSIRDLAYKINTEREEYIKKYNKEPTVDEICKLVDRSREDVVIALESTNQPMSFSEVIYNDSGDCIFLEDKIKDDNNEMEFVINNLAIKQILDNLSDKERYIIEKRYFKNKTQMELSRELGISQAQVSRIEKYALERIRKKMNKNIDI